MMIKHLSERIRICGLVVGGSLLVLLWACATRPDGPDTPRMQRIEDATHMDYPSQRLIRLEAIAREDGLMAHEQEYLVNAVFTAVSYSSMQADALVALIENPSCVDATLQHIRDKMKVAHMGGIAQERIMRALDRRAAADALQSTQQ